jgi:hypothetical protein
MKCRSARLIQSTKGWSESKRLAIICSGFGGIFEIIGADEAGVVAERDAAVLLEKRVVSCSYAPPIGPTLVVAFPYNGRSVTIML